MRYTFFIVQSANADEGGATTITPGNTLGPILALAIIVLAMVVAKRIKKLKREKQYEQKN